MDFPIPPDFARAVHERVRSGQYASTDEVLQACLRALEHAEAELEALRAEVQVGLDPFERGEVGDGKEAITDLRSRLRKAAPVRSEGTSAITLPARWREYVDEIVRAGRFSSPEVVIQAALTRLHAELQNDEMTEEDLEALRREIQLGIDSGDDEETYSREEVIAHMRAKLAGGRP